MNPPAHADAPPLIELANVSVVRGRRTVIEGLSLAIGRGEHTAILGPNGSGKSTFIKLLTRECYPLAQAGGSMRILGSERWDVAQLRTMLGIVSNDLERSFNRPMPVSEAVLSGFFSSVGLSTMHAVTPAMQARAQSVMALLDLERLSGRPVNELSSGELRRVTVARALVHDPVALVFDEPTASLDFRAHAELLQTIRRLAAGGTTVVMVTHDLRDIIHEIRRVVVFGAGRALADGAPEDVLNSALISRAFGIPIDVRRTPAGFDVSAAV